MPANKALIIGITGNIGTGKSTFCRILENKGYNVFYADKIAHNHLLELKDMWVKRWGEGVLENGEVKREKISEIVFNNPIELKWLNSQIHPRVLQDMQDLADNYPKKYLFLEIPLLYEAGLLECVDQIVLVLANTEEIIERVMKRDGSKREDILKRLEKQIPDSKKILLADYMVFNSGELEEMEWAADDLLRRLKKLKPEPKKPFYPQS
ncbi:MAG: dephospho-CoA kinase [Candidatus Cloacimonetes bacterium]|nr:dephospho-CoA kinase [Candidatus Cloacimonadota bacterium]